MELSPQIHEITTVRGANTYVVIGDTSAKLQDGLPLTLIDTGMPGNAAKIVDFLRTLSKVQTVNCTIVLTHPDIDHAGSVAELKERLEKVKVAIHEADAPRLAGEKPPKEVLGNLGVLFKIMSPFMRLKPVKPDIILRDGDTIDGLDVIHTPGHTEGSICLYSETLKAIFVGDALRTNKDRSLKPPSAAMSLNIEEAKNSIRKLASYDFELLLSGHGPPILKEGSKKVKDFATSLM